MGGFNLQELMSQAKRQYEVLQKKMEETIVEASSGGGSVTVKMDGKKQVLNIQIDPEVVKAGDLEMLQDLVAAAVNAAGKKLMSPCNPLWAGCWAAWDFRDSNERRDN